MAERPDPSIGGCVKLDKETNRGVYPLVDTLRPLLARHTETRNMCLVRFGEQLLLVMRRTERKRIYTYVSVLSSL